MCYNFVRNYEFVEELWLTSGLVSPKSGRESDREEQLWNESYLEKN